MYIGEGGYLLAQRRASSAFQNHTGCLPPTGRLLEGGSMAQGSRRSQTQRTQEQVGQGKKEKGHGEAWVDRGSRKKWKGGRGKGGRELPFSVLFCWPLRSHHEQERKEACPAPEDRECAQRTPHPTSRCLNLPLAGLRLPWLQI